MSPRAVAALAILLLGACATARDSQRQFIIRVATYWRVYDANVLEYDLSSQGYHAYVDETTISPLSARLQSGIIAADRGTTYPTPTRYRVFVGPYDTAEEAQRIGVVLRSAGYRPVVFRTRR